MIGIVREVALKGSLDTVVIAGDTTSPRLDADLSYFVLQADNAQPVLLSSLADQLILFATLDNPEIYGEYPAITLSGDLEKTLSGEWAEPRLTGYLRTYMLDLFLEGAMLTLEEDYSWILVL